MEAVNSTYQNHIHLYGKAPTHLFLGPDAQEILREWERASEWMIRHDPQCVGKPKMIQGMTVIKTMENGLSAGTFVSI